MSDTHGTQKDWNESLKSLTLKRKIRVTLTLHASRHATLIRLLEEADPSCLGDVIADCAEAGVRLNTGMRDPTDATQLISLAIPKHRPTAKAKPVKSGVVKQSAKAVDPLDAENPMNRMQLSMTDFQNFLSMPTLGEIGA